MKLGPFSLHNHFLIYNFSNAAFDYLADNYYVVYLDHSKSMFARKEQEFAKKRTKRLKEKG